MTKVVYSDKESLASTSGILFWKKITLGRLWPGLSDEEKAAVLAHELGHVKKWHIEKRILCFLFRPHKLIELCVEQEFEADEYACDNGSWIGLCSVLKNYPSGGFSHPESEERVAKIKKYVHASPRLSPVKG